MYVTQYDSPLGKLLLTCSEEALTGLWIDRKLPCDGIYQEDHPVLQEAKQWLDGYFQGDIRPVTFALAPEGTEFQKLVWNCLLSIPCGRTRTYGEIAREIAKLLGKVKMSAQAIGGAVGRNPISILIPCHRVVGARGQLTGYAAGLEKKVWLLEHEGRRIKENNVM